MKNLENLEKEQQMELKDAQALFSASSQIRQAVYQKGQETFKRWEPQLHRPFFRPSALNLAYYLALREHDLRPLQTALMPWGFPPGAAVKGGSSPT